MYIYIIIYICAGMYIDICIYIYIYAGMYIYMHILNCRYIEMTEKSGNLRGPHREYPGPKEAGSASIGAFSFLRVVC